MAVTQHRDTHIEALALIYSRLRVTVKLTNLLWGSDLFDLFWVLGWRLTCVTDGDDSAKNGVLAGGGEERVRNKWGTLGQ
jgi:hypothetical protein